MRGGDVSPTDATSGEIACLVTVSTLHVPEANELERLRPGIIGSHPDALQQIHRDFYNRVRTCSRR